MSMLLLSIALQAAAPAATQQWSVLDDPARCAPAPGHEGDVVVCGDRQTQRLPLPEERGLPDRPIPSNPKVDGVGAMAAGPPPCGADQRGCLVGFGPPIDYVAAAKGAVGLVKSAFARKPDREGRVAIDLDAAPPAGRLEP